MKWHCFSLVRLLSGPQPSLTHDDPWQHPALWRMSERDLADLPFPRGPDIKPCDTPAGGCPPD
ncbi:MAG: hypothetical protein EAZ40_18490 [Rhodobacterales bacterium]|nr:MAG: hypothetical protein EAZ40_18490 [Rhodobacterales bacterium]